MEATIATLLDNFDRALLRIVQRNARLTHEQLGNEVGLSPSAVRRRLKRMRETGVIVGDVSLVAPDALGVTIIVNVRMEKESAQTYGRFKSRMADCPEVSQCYSVSGEADFILVTHHADMTAYDGWIAEHLLSDADINRSTANIVYSRVKFDTALPIPD